MPVAVGVLRRQLHDDKEFNDFYEQWMPAESHTNPVEVDGKTYHQYLPVPVRVINAINLNDPKDIISIGLSWCDEGDFKAFLAKAEEESSNLERRDSIAEVAEKRSSEIFMTSADTNLGT